MHLRRVVLFSAFLGVCACATPPEPFVLDGHNFTIETTIAVGEGPHGIRFSDDGQTAWVALSAENRVAEVDLQAGRVIEKHEAGTTPLDIVQMVSGEWLVSQFQGNQLLQLKDNATHWVVPRGPSLFTPKTINNLTYITSEFADTLTVFDVAEERIVATYPTGQRPYPADVTRDGVLVFVPNRTDSTVSVIDLLNETAVTATHVCPRPEGGALTVDEVSYIVACGGSNELAFVNTASFEVTHRITEGVGPRPFSVAVTQDGRFGFVNNAGGTTVSVLDVASKRIIGNVPTGEQPIVIRMHPDGKRVFVANEVSGTLTVIRLPEAPQSIGANTPNEVVMLGMLHSGHIDSERYGLDVVRDVIREIKPDYVLTEIPPNRFEQAITSFLRDGAIDEPRVLRFPEYVDVLFPLIHEMDVEIIPTAGWNSHMNDYRRAALQRLSHDPARAEEWATYQAAIAASREALSAGGATDDPYWIHTDAYDEAMDLRYGVYNQLFNDDLGTGGWDTINEAHYSHIAEALDHLSGQGKRILITYGAAHKVWFLRELRKRDDITLLEVATFLDALESE